MFAAANAASPATPVSGSVVDMAIIQGVILHYSRVASVLQQSMMCRPVCLSSTLFNDWSHLRELEPPKFTYPRTGAPL